MIDAPDDATRDDERAKDPVRLLEAILFVAGGAVLLDRLRTALGTDLGGVERHLRELQVRLHTRGLAVQRHQDAAEMVTAPDLARAVEAFLGSPTPQRLSHAALEALAVVAYREPVTRAQIEAVRGVDSSGVIGTLLARELIVEVGRLPGPGHPVQFATTPYFLQLFGLSSLADLPALTTADGTALAEVWARRVAALDEP